ncbi:UDP-N-acetylglucosamine 2-epimerase [candidate division WWE3 bacterium RBG_19FT_COMBO_53_11]|uniref:UDP-N-acetylglucosamine 2-epimerase n=1 Tax=candidate division WWE3 bacterium RBG_19FT_COMBO_53_11 TaxID=1802613 RepID=A0A1F4UJ50_UNCKA|nr:MAG: UDP-N-acetylglucosamine 2-epimerase [candidate division WWE3 bacterium RBG_16_52_45]OGC44892.1 MAG: UDP-N-acetylglucosamine 2-epimerase [candidate division WWE3 bacterium RBG_19FT_COMBO_53_11]
MKICISLGTRPEIIKMSSVIRECARRKLDYFILHTNQHYSKNLDEIFFKELDLPKPKYNLNIGSGTHGEQTGRMLIEIEKVFLKEKPDVVLVQGDTNTVLASALAAAKLHIKVGHVEAGLRSYFREMPEEINRVLADHCSDFLFAPTKNAESILIGEGIPKEKVFVTGNTVVDAVRQNLELAGKKSRILEKLGLDKSGYFLITTHRPENVDKKERLAGILEGLNLVYKRFNLPVIYPIHPRTAKMVETFKLKIPAGTRVVEPVGYLDFLNLERNAKLVLTDSGGIQEEVCILRVPCVTLRGNTERPETLEVGGNILAGADPGKILKSAERMFTKNKKWKNPFGDGRAGERIVEYILRNGKR